MHVKKSLLTSGRCKRQNFSLYLSCLAEGMLRRVGRPGSEAGEEIDIAKRIQDFQIRNADVKNHLKAAKSYLKEVSR